MNGSIGKQFLKEYIESSKPIISAFLTEEINKIKEFGEISVKLLESFREMAAEGKGIRGALTVLGYQIFGGEDLVEIRRTSTFLEIFHAGILVQDDFMDRDDIRRGLPTIHKRFEKVGKDVMVRIPFDHYGNSVALCLSDAALYLSWKILLSSNLPRELVINAGSIYANYIVRLAFGQSLDLTVTGMEDYKEDDVLKVIWTKSGEYTGLLPLMVGAALAGGKDSQKLENIKNYARCFGWAFQIQDDILGLYADEEKLGKPVGSDLREGKNTLFMLYLRKNGTQPQKKFQSRILGNKDITKEDVKKMRRMLKDSGSYQHVVDMGWKYVEEGKKYVPLITNDKKLAEILESLLVYMMERTK